MKVYMFLHWNIQHSIMKTSQWFIAISTNFTLCCPGKARLAIGQTEEALKIFLEAEQYLSHTPQHTAYKDTSTLMEKARSILEYEDLWIFLAIYFYIKIWQYLSYGWWTFSRIHTLQHKALVCKIYYHK